MMSIVRIAFRVNNNDKYILHIRHFLGAVEDFGHITRNDCYFNSYTEDYNKLGTTRAHQLRFSNNPFDYLAILKVGDDTKIILYLSTLDKILDITQHIINIVFSDDIYKEEITLYKARSVN